MHPQKRPALTPLLDQATDELREIVRLHGRLDQDFGDHVRQLHRLVDLCFPEFTRLVRTLDSLRATTILRKYPTAEAFDDSCPSDLAKLRYEDGRHVVGPKLAHSLLETARASVARHHGPAYRDEMRHLCDEIDSMRGRLQDLVSDIEHRLHKHPAGSLLTRIEGIGALSAARIVAAVGDPARFRNGAALAAYVGAVPATNLSGLPRAGHASLSPLGNARLRRALYMTTLGAVQRNPWLRAFYQRPQAKGKLPKVALMAAMRNLLLADDAVEDAIGESPEQCPARVAMDDCIGSWVGQHQLDGRLDRVEVFLPEATVLALVPPVGLLDVGCGREPENEPQRLRSCFRTSCQGTPSG